MAEELEIEFGRSGSGPDHQGIGWSTREPDGVWMVDGESTLALPRPARPGDYLLSLDVETLVGPGHEFQRLSVRVNGVSVGSQVMRAGGVVQCWVPWPVLGEAATSTVSLRHPDGWSPSETEAGAGDLRVLSFYVRTIRLSLLTGRPSAPEPAPPGGAAHPEDAAQPGSMARPPTTPRPAAPSRPGPAAAAPPGRDGPAMHALVLDFESLGPGCALGLVQRHHGAEPLGLFRFARTPLDGLVAALDGDVRAALAGPASLVLDPDTRAFSLVDAAHGFEWHTGLHEGQADPGALERQWRARLPWLAERFHEVLEGGAKILVLCDEAAPSDPAQVGRLLGLLRRRGPVTLLWVGAAGDGHAAGEAEWAGDALLRGWTDGSMAAWGEVCRRAHRLWTAARARQAA